MRSRDCLAFTVEEEGRQLTCLVSNTGGLSQDLFILLFIRGETAGSKGVVCGNDDALGASRLIEREGLLNLYTSLTSVSE